MARVRKGLGPARPRVGVRPVEQKKDDPAVARGMAERRGLWLATLDVQRTLAYWARSRQAEAKEALAALAAAAQEEAERATLQRLKAKYEGQ